MLLILLLALIEVSSSQPVQVIQVDPVTGFNNKTCWTGSVPCGSLNYALRGVTNNNTRLQLASGSFNLSTYNTTLIGLSSITIEGAGVVQTMVTCNYSDAGLYFVEVDHLTIANLTISNCGMLQNSTTWNISSPAKYPSAITVYNSSNIIVYSASFQHNNGIGLSIVNTGGVVTISNSVFDGNYVCDDGEYPGGGGLYIEFPFCLPGNFNNSISSSTSRNSHSIYIVDSCNFANNVARKMTKQSSNVTLSCHCSTETFGRGGGMSIFIRGYATNNTITITNTIFASNVAEWGAGLLINFDHYSNSNRVIVKGNSQFSDNRCIVTTSHSGSGGGGGVQIVYSSFENTYSPINNEVFFSQCNFTNNTAYWGGGVSYVMFKEQRQLGTNILHFADCLWQKNVARFGSAVDLSLYRSLLVSGVVQPVVFEDCLFVQNVLSSPGGQFELQGIGTLYTSSIAIMLNSSVSFNANNGSALVISAADITIDDNCIVTFVHNKGRRGAAVSLLASSWINIRDNTTVTFTSNKADDMGGAIYAELINEHNVIATWNCFFQYFNATVEPNMWNTKIQFQQNVANHGGHSIYATTLRSCLWGKSYTRVNQDNIKDVFHWEPFEFEGVSGLQPFVREMEIATDANFLSTNISELKISPGQAYHLPFTQSDDKGQPASTVLFIQSNDEEVGKVNKRSVFVYSDILQVYGEPNSTFNITVTSLGHIASTATLNITFDYCPPGYVPYPDKTQNATSCKCANERSNGYLGISGCDHENYLAYITRYHWGGIHQSTNEFVTTNCPQGFCNFAKSHYEMPLPNNRTQLDKSQCHPQHRTGTICGECMDGYSMSSGSNCIRCDHGTMKGILLFLLYECLPTLVFVSIILFFNINITSGHWNSLIFYFQILETLNLYALRTNEEFSKPVSILIKIHMTLFGIWNLDFFRYFMPDVCYINGMKNVFEVFALKYFTVLFAFALIILVTMFKNFRHFNCICWYLEAIVCPGKCSYFKQKCILITVRVNKLFGRTSLIHGLATFIILSYTKITLISIYFFIPGPIYRHGSEIIEMRLHYVGTMRYFSREHMIYVAPAFVLITISAMLPGYLILRPLVGNKCGNTRLCQNCYKIICCCVRQDKLDQLLEEFYGSFKKDCRFYAGFFFLFRFALYVTLTFSPTLQIQYTVQQCLLGGFLFLHSLFQPYGERYRFANKLDALIFMNLIVINALSVYKLYSVFDVQGESHAVTVIQMVLVYLPLVYVLFRFIWWSEKTCVKVCAEDDGERMYLLAQNIVVDPEGERERIAVELQDSTYA